MITQQKDWRKQMKNLFGRFKRETQQSTSVMCNNLSTTNDCRLVSEIKDCQTKLDAIELEINALRQLDDDISEFYLLFDNFDMRHICYIDYYGIDPISKDKLISSLRNVFKDINFNKLIEELTILHDKAVTLENKENEAKHLREKINEAKNALGIK